MRSLNFDFCALWSRYHRSNVPQIWWHVPAFTHWDLKFSSTIYQKWDASSLLMHMNRIDVPVFLIIHWFLNEPYCIYNNVHHLVCPACAYCINVYLLRPTCATYHASIYPITRLEVESFSSMVRSSFVLLPSVNFIWCFSTRRSVVASRLAESSTLMLPPKFSPSESPPSSLDGAAMAKGSRVSHEPRSSYCFITLFSIDLLKFRLLHIFQDKGSKIYSLIPWHVSH